MAPGPLDAMLRVTGKRIRVAQCRGRSPHKGKALCPRPRLHFDHTLPSLTPLLLHNEAPHFIIYLRSVMLEAQQTITRQLVYKNLGPECQGLSNGLVRPHSPHCSCSTATSMVDKGNPHKAHTLLSLLQTQLIWVDARCACKIVQSWLYLRPSSFPKLDDPHQQ